MLYHPGPNPTVDIIVQKETEEEISILLIKRLRTVDTEAGKLALPGGFIDTDAEKGSAWTSGVESEIEAAKRELLEETGLDVQHYHDSSFQFLGIYDKPERDPRNTNISWTESHVFKIVVQENEGENIEGLDDAEEAKWYSISELKSMKSDEFAFDHYLILSEHVLK